MVGHSTYHVYVIKLKYEVIWIGGNLEKCKCFPLGQRELSVRMNESVLIEGSSV